jgi:hypothetical protein
MRPVAAIPDEGDARLLWRKLLLGLNETRVLASFKGHICGFLFVPKAAPSTHGVTFGSCSPADAPNEASPLTMCGELLALNLGLVLLLQIKLKAEHEAVTTVRDFEPVYCFSL